MTSLVSRTSSAPSGAPCASPVSIALGAGNPMWLRSAMIDGRSRSSRAAAMAARIAARSSASSTRCVCQPYDAKRASTSSLNATAVSPSMEMWLSS